MKLNLIINKIDIILYLMKRHNLKKKFFFNKFLIFIFNFNKCFIIEIILD